MDHRFDLLGLPRLAFDNIYQYLGFEDIILLAACSKRTQASVKAKEGFLKKVTACELYIDGDSERHIMLEDVGRFQNRYTFIIDVWTLNPLHNWFGYKLIEGTFRGTHWQIQRIPDNWKVYGDTLDVILSWYQFVKDTFNCHLTIYIRLRNNFAEQVDELYETDVLHVADKMTLRYGRITNFQMKHILDNVEAHELQLSAYPLDCFQYDKVLTRIPIISLVRPLWLSTDQTWEMVQGGVRQMDFPEIVSWTSWKFNRFLRKWLKSDNKTLEYMRFAFDKGVCIPAMIFDGIATTPATIGTGRVICRGDGVRATIVLQGKIANREYYSSFRVCHDPNRNL